MPNNTPMGMFIAAAAFAIGFAIIWHIWWLALVGVVALVILLIVRLSSDDPHETVLSVDAIKVIEATSKRRYA